MSLHTPCIGCSDVPITFDHIIKSIIRKDVDGNFYLPLKINICDEDDELAVGCDASDYTVEELIRRLLVIDDCGHCAIKVSIDAGSLELICDACDQRQL